MDVQFLLDGDAQTLDRLGENDGAIDRLRVEILGYLGKRSLRDLVEPQPHRMEE